MLCYSFISQLGASCMYIIDKMRYFSCMLPCSGNLLREEIFANPAILLSEEIFAIFVLIYLAIFAIKFSLQRATPDTIRKIVATDITKQRIITLVSYLARIYDAAIAGRYSLKMQPGTSRSASLCVRLRNFGYMAFSARVYNDGGFLSSKIP